MCRTWPFWRVCPSICRRLSCLFRKPFRPHRSWPCFEAAHTDKLSDEVVGDVNALFLKFASYCRSFDVGPHDAFVLRISGHMLGSQLKKCLFPFRVGVGFLLCTASRLADSVALKARFVTKFMNSLDNRSSGNSQKRAQRPYRATIGVPSPCMQ